ncbi:MAG: hypothetical protein AAGI48_17710 [Verrucomicrobiota bacterium]
MADRTYCSAVRVVWDPDGVGLILVDWDEVMTDRVKLNGRQVVQESDPVRSVGIDTHPRGNERHELTFGRRFEEQGLEQALENRIQRSLRLPRTKADVLLVFQDSGTQFRLRKASVRAWPSDQDGNRTDDRVEIIGGEVVEDTGSYNTLTNWGDDYYIQPDGGLYLQAGGDLYLRPN